LFLYLFVIELLFVLFGGFGWGGIVFFFFIPHTRKLTLRHRCFALRKAGKVDVHVHDDVCINIWMTHVYAFVVICF